MLNCVPYHVRTYFLADATLRKLSREDNLSEYSDDIFSVEGSRFSFRVQKLLNRE